MVYYCFMKKEETTLNAWTLDALPPGVTAWPAVVGQVRKRLNRRMKTGQAVAVHLLTKGSAIFTTYAGEFTLRAGDMFSMWPEVAHDLRQIPGDNFSLYWTRMNGPGVEELSRKWGFTPDCPVRRPDIPAAAEKAFRAVFEYWGRNVRNPFHGLSLFYNLLAVSSPHEESIEGDLSYSEIVTESEIVIESMLETGINVNELAGMLGVSRSTLWRAFKAVTDQTPHEWIRSQRILQACNFLKQKDLTLQEISYACGFKSEKYFMRCFKNVTGTTPGKWRQQAG